MENISMPRAFHQLHPCLKSAPSSGEVCWQHTSLLGEEHCLSIRWSTEEGVCEVISKEPSHARFGDVNLKFAHTGRFWERTDVELDDKAWLRLDRFLRLLKAEHPMLGIVDPRLTTTPAHHPRPRKPSVS